MMVLSSSDGGAVMFGITQLLAVGGCLGLVLLVFHLPSLALPDRAPSDTISEKLV